MPPASTPTTLTRPVSVALVDDYDVVVMGVANILEQYRDQVVVAELDANRAVNDVVDIVLYDSFAQPESDQDEIAVLVRNPNARRVVVYTWNFAPDLVDSALNQGVSGYLSKALPARELVAALCAVHAGQIVVSPIPARSRSINGLDWRGRREGLTDREPEVLALITQVKPSWCRHLSVNDTPRHPILRVTSHDTGGNADGGRDATRSGVGVAPRQQVDVQGLAV
jgi:DNA-binding NarL/FixJ family response regulator